MKREDNEVMAEREDGFALRGAERVMMHTGAHQIGLTEGQKHFEYAMAQLIEVPTRLAEEAVERTKVFEAGELA